MRRFLPGTSALIAALALVVPLADGAAQDPAVVAPQNYKVLLENDQVRVLEVKGRPGEKIPMHSHPDYVVYVLAASKVRFIAPDGTAQDADLAQGHTQFTTAHDHAAEVKSDIHVLLVELKGGAKAGGPAGEGLPPAGGPPGGPPPQGPPENP